MKWHRQMCKNGNLYVLMKDKAIVGGAIMFEDEKDADIVYVGRIFVDALQYRKGYGKEIMQQIEEGIVAHSLIQSNEEIFFTITGNIRNHQLLQQGMNYRASSSWIFLRSLI